MSYATVEDEEDSGWCRVCGSGATTPDDLIVFCDRCDVAVHQACYGVASVPEGQWYCKPCAMGVDTASTPCVLCPVVGGALVPCAPPVTSARRSLGAPSRQTWTHAVCALWMPGVQFENAEAMEGVVGMRTVDPERFSLKCRLCKKKKGPCIQCASPSCIASFHPSCALDACHEMRLEFDPRTEGVVAVSYCPKHCSKNHSLHRPPPPPQLSPPLLVLGQALASPPATSLNNRDLSDSEERPVFARILEAEAREAEAPRMSAAVAAPATRTGHSHHVPHRRAPTTSRTDATDDELSAPVCSLCLESNTAPDNEILFCDGCEVSVHQQCYGVPTNSAQQSRWHCKPCASGANTAKLQCVLCFQTGGAMAPCEGTSGLDIAALARGEQNWAHMLCAIWVPGIDLGESDLLEPVRGVEAALTARSNKSSLCKVCGMRGGGLIKCDARSCKHKFHPFCAQSAGFAMEYVSDKNGDLQLNAECDQHVGGEREEVRAKPKNKTRASSGSTSGRKKKDSSNKSKSSKEKDDDDDDIEDQFKAMRAKHKAAQERQRKNDELVRQQVEAIRKKAMAFKKDVVSTVCDACGEWDPECCGPLRCCVKCKVSVHPACVGVSESDEPDTTRFKCRLCSEGKQTAKLSCVLCPQVGGALVPCVTSKPTHEQHELRQQLYAKKGADASKAIAAAKVETHIHIACALWMPGPCFRTPELLDEVHSIGNIDKLRCGLLCDICQQRRGACIECQHPSCKVSFHVSCAVRTNKYELGLEADEDDGVKFVSMCAKHSAPGSGMVGPGLAPEPATADECDDGGGNEREEASEEEDSEDQARRRRPRKRKSNLKGERHDGEERGRKRNAKKLPRYVENSTNSDITLESTWNVSTAVGKRCSIPALDAPRPNEPKAAKVDMAAAAELEHDDDGDDEALEDNGSLDDVLDVDFPRCVDATTGFSHGLTWSWKPHEGVTPKSAFWHFFMRSYAEWGTTSSNMPLGQFARACRLQWTAMDQSARAHFEAMARTHERKFKQQHGSGKGSSEVQRLVSAVFEEVIRDDGDAAADAISNDNPEQAASKAVVVAGDESSRQASSNASRLGKRNKRGEPAGFTTALEAYTTLCDIYFTPIPETSSNGTGDKSGDDVRMKRALQALDQLVETAAIADTADALSTSKLNKCPRWLLEQPKSVDLDGLVAELQGLQQDQAHTNQKHLGELKRQVMAQVKLELQWEKDGLDQVRYKAATREQIAAKEREHAQCVVDEEVHCGECRGGSSVAGNMIVVCEGCERAVHQRCYGIQTVPEGDWLCRPCEAMAEEDAVAAKQQQQQAHSSNGVVLT